jgi:hypothetical protein
MAMAKPELLTEDGGASYRRDYAKDAAVCIGRRALLLPSFKR